MSKQQPDNFNKSTLEKSSPDRSFFQVAITRIRQSMLTKVSERRLHRTRFLRTTSWLLLLFSLFYTPSANAYNPQNAEEKDAMTAMTTNDDLSLLGNEVEIDGISYVSVDFLQQHPEYLDQELEREFKIDDEVDYTDKPEEGEFDESLSTHKSQIEINGTTFIAMPVLRSNPNYVELKYNQKANVSLSTFIPNKMLKENAVVVAYGYRRRYGK